MKRAKQDSFTVLNIGGRCEKMFKVKSTYMFSLITLKHLFFQKYSVMPRFSDCPLMWMERAATSRFWSTISGFYIIPVFELYEQTMLLHCRSLWGEAVWSSYQWLHCQ